MLSSVLELLPNLKSTYFASMNPPSVFERIILLVSSVYARSVGRGSVYLSVTKVACKVWRRLSLYKCDGGQGVI